MENKIKKECRSNWWSEKKGFTWWQLVLIIIALCYIVTQFDSKEDAFIIISCILGGILLFLLIRELVCWYWKINYRIIKQDEICNLLVKQIKILEQINDNTKKTE